MKRTHPSRRKAQAGLFLLEALVSILIFSLGILGLVAMGGTAISAQSDAQYRNEAASLATDIASRISLGVDPLDVAGTLAAYQHLPVIAGYCNFTGRASTNAVVTTWLDHYTGADGTPGLPGAINTKASVKVETDPDAHNRVTVTVCWKPPSTGLMAEPWHRHELISYVNL